MQDNQQVTEYVDQIMKMIDKDIANPDYRNSRGDRMPSTVASWQELHDHVDANYYLIDTEVPFPDPDEPGTVELNMAITDEITRRLSQRARGRVIYYEARCQKCDETFNPADEQDLEHIQTFDDEPCGGEGIFLGGHMR